MKKPITAVVLLVSHLFFSANDGLGREADDDEVTLIQKTVVPESIKGLSWGATIDLGTLVSGKKYRIRLDMTNPSGSVMSFSKLTKNCSCFDAQVSRLVLEPGQALSVELTAPVPKKLGRSDSNWYFMLEPKPGSKSGGIYVRMNYSIAGVMEFLQPRVVCESLAATGKEHFLIPMLITPPVEAKNLHFRFPKELSMLKGDAVIKDGNHFLQITVESGSVESRYLAGEIRCIDVIAGQEDVIYCVLKKSEGASVHPGIIRVVIPDDSVGNAYATALVRLVVGKEDKKDFGTVRERKGDVLIDAFFGEYSLPLSVDRLSTSTFRVKIAFSEAVLKEIENATSAKIQWVIRTNDLSYEVISRVSVP